MSSHIWVVTWEPFEDEPACLYPHLGAIFSSYERAQSYADAKNADPNFTKHSVDCWGVDRADVDSGRKKPIPPPTPGRGSGGGTE